MASENSSSPAGGPPKPAGYSFYDASFNWIWKKMGPDVDKKLAPWKKELYSQAQGNILEIGSGHGATFQYLDADKISHVTCLEPNPAMHDILRETAAKHGFDESKGTLTLVCTPAEASAPSWYKDSTDPAQTPHYDAILSSLVLCTVHDEKHVLENVHSWLRPGGKFYFLEHAGDNPETWRGWTQIWFTPVWKYLGHGCHLDRDHLAMLKGIELDGKKLFADVDGRPIDPEEKEIQGMWIARPLVYGTALKA